MPESNFDLPYHPGLERKLSPHEERMRDERIAGYEFVLANLKRMLEEANNKPEKEHILGYN